MVVVGAVVNRDPGCHMGIRCQSVGSCALARHLYWRVVGAYQFNGRGAIVHVSAQMAAYEPELADF